MQKLTADQLLSKQIGLSTASVSWNPEDDTHEAVADWFNEYLRLPKSIRYGMINSQTSQAVAKIAQVYKIYDYKKIGEISRIIREVFTRGVREREIMQRAKENLGLPEHEVGHFLKDVQAVIVLVKRIGEEELAQSTEKLSIIPALRSYPKVGEQRISESLIKLISFEQPVLPTVKNWLEDYFSRMGTGKHSSIERSDYLFNSENGKKLAAAARNNLGIILRSYDNEEQLTVHTIRQEILFTEGVGIEKAAGLPQNAAKPPMAGIAGQPKTSASVPHPRTTSLEDAALKSQGDVKMNPLDYNIGKNNLIFPITSFTMVDAQKEAARKNADAQQSANAAQTSKSMNLKVEDKTPPTREVGKNIVDLSSYF